MKVCVVGQATLSEAVATCCARFFEVTREPGPAADVLWVCYDTPIVDGIPDVQWVVEQCTRDIGQVAPECVVVLSSQVTIGTTRRLEGLAPGIIIACVPENIRVARAVEDFDNQSRIVVGMRTNRGRETLQRLLSPYTGNIIWTDPETAEMTKHALNCFLGLSIAWINEIARIAKPWGVDMDALSRALLAERRISPEAPLRAGQPFGGGHLARDIFTLAAMAEKEGHRAPIVRAILPSNGPGQ